jgi:hypothetical protein
MLTRSDFYALCFKLLTCPEHCKRKFSMKVWLHKYRESHQEKIKVEGLRRTQLKEMIDFSETRHDREKEFDGILRKGAIQSEGARLQKAFDSTARVSYGIGTPYMRVTRWKSNRPRANSKTKNSVCYEPDSFDHSKAPNFGYELSGKSGKYTLVMLMGAHG